MNALHKSYIITMLYSLNHLRNGINDKIIIMKDKINYYCLSISKCN